MLAGLTGFEPVIGAFRMRTETQVLHKVLSVVFLENF